MGQACRFVIFLIILFISSYQNAFATFPVRNAYSPNTISAVCQPSDSNTKCGSSSGGGGTPGGAQGDIQFLDVQGTVTEFGGNSGLYYSGTGSSAGNVGIGSINPGQKLDVQGTIRSTNLTDTSMTAHSLLYAGTGGTVSQDNSNLFYNGSQLTFDGVDSYGALHIQGRSGGEASIAIQPDNVSNGSCGQWVMYTNGSSLTNTSDYAWYDSCIGKSAFNILGPTGNIGIGSINPGQSLDVQGTVRMVGFQMNTSPASGYVLTSDSTGNGSWAVASSGSPGGSNTDVQYNDSSSFGGNSSFTYDGSGDISLTGYLKGTSLVVSGTNSVSLSNNGVIEYLNPNMRFSLPSTESFYFYNQGRGTNLLMELNGSNGDVNIPALTASEITATDSSKNLESLSTGTYPSLTELSYVKGVTSSVQTQISGITSSQWTGTNPIYFNTGNVGIGSSSPGTMLDVQGTVRSIGWKPTIVTVTQSATPAIDTDSGQIFQITSLAQAITSMTSSLTGTPFSGQMIEIQITDNGSSYNITWGSSFESTTVILPTATVISTRLRIFLEWNTTTSKWSCVGVA